MLLSELFDNQHIMMDLESTTKTEAFEELTRTLAELHPELDREEILEAVTVREDQMNTAIAPGIAVPHGCCRDLQGIVGIIGLSQGGIAYDAEDRKPVHCIFLMVMGDSCREKHLRILGHLLEILQTQVIQEIMACRSPQEIHDILGRY